jgi:hypothetical protein
MIYYLFLMVSLFNLENGSVKIHSMLEPTQTPLSFESLSGITEPITKMCISRNAAIFCTENQVYTYQAIAKHEPFPKSDSKLFNFLAPYLGIKTESENIIPRSISQTILTTKPEFVGNFSNISSAACGWDHFLLLADPVKQNEII